MHQEQGPLIVSVYSHTQPPLDAFGRGYPRPQLARSEWTSLNGAWDFAVDPEGRRQTAAEITWTHQIQVPFAPEAPASGVTPPAFFHACWYRRRIAVPDLSDGKRCFLHFGAVDYESTVWINGRFAGTHRGGYTPFSIDLTRVTAGTSSNEVEVIVRACDDPHDLSKPRGKQDWQRQAHSIWYPRTTGIWQTVWLEVVPRAWIKSIRWTPNLERWEIGTDVRIAGGSQRALRLRLRLAAQGTVIADDTYAVIGGEIHRRIALSDPGIDDYRNALLWSPETPTLIQAELHLLDGDQVVDRVTSYTALRTYAIQRDRVVLNNRPYPLRLVLDQGYWPETGSSAPDDAALKKDVELAKALGFNGVRKHQKLEDPRYLYWADVLGLLVWGEMPSAYRFTQDSIERVTHEWMAALARDYSHPCVMAWVPINESWGVPNLPDIAAERHYVQALYHLTRTLDPTRPVIGNDGWESVATDILGIHDYDHDPERLARRYRGNDELPRLFRRERPGGRILLLDGQQRTELPVVLSEFGGIALSSRPSTWGYSRVPNAEELARRYERLMEAVHSIGLLSGFCYTQFADTYQEANGLLFANRQPKCDIGRLRDATRGRRIPAPQGAAEDLQMQPAANAEGPEHVQALDEEA
jgi:beta-galactosidase/beta-glucuronidase